MRNEDFFIEIDHFKANKKNNPVCGDVFISGKDGENRKICILSDGLGSGVKASVLATLTARMAFSYIKNNFDIKKASKTIMNTLPVCSTRKISYSTFTIIDINNKNDLKIIEYDNPEFIFIRDNKVMPIEKTEINLGNHNDRKNTALFSHIKVRNGDSVIFFSDGVSQSGIGSPLFPFGWGNTNICAFVEEVLEKGHDLSAADISRLIVNRSIANDDFNPKDDTSCAVINFRTPRILNIYSGPPYHKESDKILSNMVRNDPGKKIICGGTTANIISRELERKITMEIRKIDPEIPPYSHMDGTDLITEGIITLSKVREMLKKNNQDVSWRENAASKIYEHIVNSDVINFVVGTRINEVHQDPNMPVELGIRRNIVRSICSLLEEDLLKKTNIRFI